MGQDNNELVLVIDEEMAEELISVIGRDQDPSVAMMYLYTLLRKSLTGELVGHNKILRLHLQNHNDDSCEFCQQAYVLQSLES